MVTPFLLRLQQLKTVYLVPPNKQKASQSRILRKPLPRSLEYFFPSLHIQLGFVYGLALVDCLRVRAVRCASSAAWFQHKLVPVLDLDNNWAINHFRLPRCRRVVPWFALVLGLGVQQIVTMNMVFRWFASSTVFTFLVPKMMIFNIGISFWSFIG